MLVLGYFVVFVVLVTAARSYLRVFRTHLRDNLRVGMVAGLVIGALLGITVVQQPGSPAPSGLQLFWSLFWLGLVYGVLDGLLLTVLPVMALGVTTRCRYEDGWGGALVFLGLASSAAVTAAYHLGYQEYRGRQLVQPLIGNTMITAGYIITGNIAAPLTAHVLMHGAAVLHGMETTTQLPPHYGDLSRSRANSRDPLELPQRITR